MVLTAGVLTLISAGSNSARLSSTAASGGTAPYTQQWYKSADPSFIPDSSTLISNATSLILNDTNLVPHTTYYYKVVYTDSALDNATVTSSALVVTTLNAALNQNQFSMAPFIGELDLKVGGNVFSCEIDSSQILPLYAGQRVKVVPNSGGGLPKVVNNSDVFIPFGYVVYDVKSQSFINGDRCEVARTQSCMWLYATTAIDRGAQVCIDEFIQYGVQASTGSTDMPIVGIAYDEAIAPGQLIRVILETSNYQTDIISNELILGGDNNDNEFSISLVNTFLRSKVNNIESNSIDIQLPVVDPIEDNLMAMNDTGHAKDSGVAVTTDYMSNDNSHLPTTEAMQSAILAGVVAGYAYQGPYDASSGVYPSVNKIGGPIAGGEFWIITVPGTFPGPKTVEINDEILSLIDVPGQTPTNWTVRAGTVVRKFNDRDGLVYPISDDYNLEQITGAVEALALKSDLTYVDAQLALKADAAATTAALALKADTSTVNAALALKAALAGAAFSGAVTVQTPVNPTEAARKDYVDTGLALKADAAATTAALALKADTSTVNAALALKAALAGAAFSGAVTVQTPVNPTEAARKDYVDSAITGVGVLANNKIFVGNVSNVATAVPVTGDISLANTGATTLANVPSGVSTGFSAGVMHSDGTHLASSLIVDADVSASAAIAVTKLAALTAKAVVTTDISGKLAATALTNGQILIGSTGNVPAAGTITGTTNRVSVANSAGGITLSTPQDINTAATPTFASVTVSNAPSAVSDATRKDYVDTGLATKEPTITTLGIAKGGTGQITANAALNALLPSQGGNANKFLRSNATDSSWVLTTNTLVLSGQALTSTVNSVASLPVQVCPSPYGGGTAPTFTLLSEYVLVLAPSASAVGLYVMRLTDSTNKELDIIFTVCANNGTSYNYSSIQILQVNDSQGIVTPANLSSYALFRGFYRSNVTNPYFMVTISTPYTLLYSNPLAFNTYQYGASFINDNLNITGVIGLDISNLVGVYPPDLIFKMKTSYVPATIYNPQGYLYFMAGGSNAIYQFSINTSTGVLSALSPATVASPGASYIAPTKLRNYAYSSGLAPSTIIYQWRISPTDGTLSALSPASVAAGNPTTAIVVDPTDRFVYALDYGAGIILQYTITKSTGQLVAIASPPTAAGGMIELAVHPSGKFLYAINSVTNVVYQYAINTSTGALTALGTPTIATGSGPLKIVMHPSGLFAYVSNNGASTTISQYSINTTTGQLTALSSPTFTTPAGVYGLAISNDGRFIYYGCSTANVIGQSTIDTSTGLISTPSTTQAAPGARDCCIDFSGLYLNVVDNTNNRIDSFILNQTTGAMTANGTPAAGVNSVSIAAV